MSKDITYMDCWNFVAPLIPVNTDYTREIYCMVYTAMKQAEKRRLEEKCKVRKELEHET